jgi:DNA-binding IclR family transcriptional regulator
MAPKSVGKALDILEALSDAESELSLAEISATLALPTTTAQRLLGALVKRRFVARNPRTHKYVLSRKLATIGAVAFRNPFLIEASRPTLTELARETGETASLVWQYQYRALYVDQVQSDTVVRAYNPPGMSAPLHCSALGKVLLAEFAPSDAERYILQTGLPAHTRYTITNPYFLREHLEEIRQQGFAIDKQEWEMGVASVAAPISVRQTDLMGDTDVVGALGVTGPVTRLEEKGWEQLRSQVKHAASEVYSTLDSIAEEALQST